MLPLRSGTYSRPEPSGISPRWLIRAHRMRRGSVGAGVGSDLGNCANSCTVSPRLDGTGSGSGSWSGSSACAVAVAGTARPAAITALAIATNQRLGFDISAHFPVGSTWSGKRFPASAFLTLQTAPTDSQDPSKRSPPASPALRHPESRFRAHGACARSRDAVCTNAGLALHERGTRGVWLW